MTLKRHIRKHLLFTLYTSLDERKPVFGGLQTTKVQTSLRESDQRLCYPLIEKCHI